MKHAIVRTPGANFAEGLTSAGLGVPCYELALQQHSRYCEALQECGLEITKLDADLAHPDSTFVEDTAVLTAHGAILTRPGAPSRLGEVATIRPSVESFFPNTVQIEAPGTLDGGDICEAEDHFFLGLSHRTNEEGIRQLANYLHAQGYTSSVVDVRHMTSILHLKSGISYLGNNTLAVVEELTASACFGKYECILVPPGESYAANCVVVNESLLVASGHPKFLAEISFRGFSPCALDMSEFKKMDGGLSCLSLRF